MISMKTLTKINTNKIEMNEMEMSEDNLVPLAILNVVEEHKRKTFFRASSFYCGIVKHFFIYVHLKW